MEPGKDMEAEKDMEAQKDMEAEKDIETIGDSSSSLDFARLGYSVVLCVVTYLILDMAILGIFLILFLQLALSILQGRPNEQILSFSRSIGTVISSSFAYAMFLSEEKPFPFSSWPSDKGDSEDIDSRENNSNEESASVSGKNSDDLEGASEVSPADAEK